MKLDTFRGSLIEELLTACQQLMASRPISRNNEILEAVWKWFYAYKEWEEQDTFLSAFREKRLCITQRPDEDNVTSTIKTQYNMEAKRSELGKKIKYEGVTYSPGVNHLKARMDPANFERKDSDGIRRKYALGLFDLSASLLNPDYATIKGQLRWSFDSTKAKWRIIFLPLPWPEDVHMYNLIKTHAALAGDQNLKEIVRFIRNRMTRPKLAAAEDMGAGPYDLAPAGSKHPKIKYGWQSNEGVLTEETKGRVETAVTNYQKIIENAKAVTTRGDVKVVASNEITIALRQRNGERFPIITQFDAQADAFHLVGANRLFPKGAIPDKWKETVEALH